MFVIISAQVAVKRDESVGKLRHESLVADIEEAGFLATEVEGCYKGKTERSVLVTKRERSPVFRYWEIEPLRLKYGQESVLVVRDNGEAFLDFGPGRPLVSIGWWRYSPDYEPLPDSYTIIRGSRFVCGEKQ